MVVWIRIRADELEQWAKAWGEQVKAGQPHEVGDKFIVANGNKRFLAQTISRLDDVEFACAGELEAEAAGIKELAHSLARLLLGSFVDELSGTEEDLTDFIADWLRKRIFGLPAK